ncbi:BRO-N domain-containing protein [Vibrio parahaemolyticus]|uniref:BRO-N domain-containing protein n=1 Tax=Vibrio parahaemolyticus TaxID=670 RepID=UPI0006A62A4C|nr:BRO family protein [Vibrio parahaemolyticus]ODW95043.1 hypothetical protein BBM90_12965 [Vibrio parahaemolyticus]ODW95047.1 hypothetical protein BBM90_12985 [Vibrio parahaemolyticus]OTW12970.1 hypothetical protein BA743_23160 [Vibrio parahaemolyticus]OTW12974.1 hypothetical protein BA743_23180 [Vibrio parahaemolyticus]OTW26093.1 hypothetical protein BA744_11585 [Vibrio parahaemolyticus]
MKEKKHNLMYPSANGEVEIKTLEQNGKILFFFPDVVQVLSKDNAYFSTVKGKREGFNGLMSKLSTVLKDKHRVIIHRTSKNSLGLDHDFYVTEAGLYKLLTFDESAAAERFQDWVFEDVLPSIRQHGTYPPPKKGASEMSTMVALLQQNVTLLAEEIEKREELERKVMTIDDRVSAIENDAKDDELISISSFIEERCYIIEETELFWAWCQKIKLQSGADSKKPNNDDLLKYKYPLFVLEQAYTELKRYN